MLVNCVVPKGVQHRPYALEECKVMLIDHGVVNTGEAKATSLLPMTFGFEKLFFLVLDCVINLKTKFSLFSSKAFKEQGRDIP